MRAYPDPGLDDGQSSSSVASAGVIDDMKNRPPSASSDKATPVDRSSSALTAMLSGPVFPTMLRLAIPTIIVLIAQTLVGVAETYYVGFLGTAALVGVSLVFPLSMLMTMMSNGGIGGGVASAIARAKGARHHEDSDALVLHAVILAVLFGLAFSLAAVSFGPEVYRAFGGTEQAHSAAVLYSDYVFAGAIPLWIVNLCSAALRGAGNVRLPAIVTLVGACVLIFLSPAFIFGIGPIPRFGIAGAGAAVSAYYAIAACVLLGRLIHGTSGVRLRWVSIEWRLFRDILRVGTLSSISTIQLNLMVILVTASVGHFGTGALAGYGMATRLDYALIPVLFGLGTSVLTMVGTNAGAGNMARAQRIAWIGALTGGMFMETIGVLAAVFPMLWIRLFSSDPAVIESGVSYLQIAGPFYGAVGTTFILGFAAQGLGRPMWPMLAGTARLLIAGAVGWVAVSRFGANMPGLFGLVSLASMAAVLICVGAARSGRIWAVGIK